MPALAPRYPPQLLELIRQLDDPEQAIAETCRRVGAAAAALGLPRPSYVHVRRLVKVEREEQARQEELRAAVREALADVATTAFSGGSPNIARLLDALDDLER